MFKVAQKSTIPLLKSLSLLTKFYQSIQNIKFCNVGQKLYTTSQSPQIPPNEDEILFESVRRKGVITLNRPKALNAITPNMIHKIKTNLMEWENSQGLVIIKGAGNKAFCAGGDLRMTSTGEPGDPRFLEQFKKQFELCGLINSLRIPYISLIDGVTMGAGCGISVNGAYRVATEHTVFAMPETRIGLFPDNGASYFLSRMPGKLGLYLGLTGHSLLGGDVFKSGIATHVCNRNRLPDLEWDLLELDSCEHACVEKVLEKYHEESEISRKPFSLEARMNDINKLFDQSCLENIVSSLEKLANHSETNSTNKWASEVLATLSKMSPTSLKLTFHLIQTGSALSLQEVLQIDLDVAVRCTQNRDIFEGIRALLVDKDMNPKWSPATLERVTPEIIQSHLTSCNSKLSFRG